MSCYVVEFDLQRYLGRRVISSTQLPVPRGRTQWVQSLFTYCTMQSWNLPRDMVVQHKSIEAKSRSTFKGSSSIKRGMHQQISSKRPAKSTSVEGWTLCRRVVEGAMNLFFAPRSRSRRLIDQPAPVSAPHLKPQTSRSGLPASDLSRFVQPSRSSASEPPATTPPPRLKCVRYDYTYSWRFIPGSLRIHSNLFITRQLSLENIQRDRRHGF